MLLCDYVTEAQPMLQDRYTADDTAKISPKIQSVMGLLTLRMISKPHSSELTHLWDDELCQLPLNVP